MTLQELPDGAHSYTPPVYQQEGGGGQDIYSKVNPAQIPNTTVPLGAARFKVYSTDDPDVMRWTAEVYDARGGYNHPYGSFDSDHHRYTSSTLDTRFTGYLTLPVVTNATVGVNPSATSQFTVWSRNFDGKLMMAIQAFADNYTYLFNEDALGAIHAVVYNKGTSHTIQGLGVVHFKGVAYLAVCKFAQPVELLSDSNGTSAGSMHALTTKCYGIIECPAGDLNTSNSILIRAKGTTGAADWSIWGLPASAAIGDAPTELITQLPAGGYAIGLAALGGSPLRAYWNWPTDAPSGSALQPGGDGLTGTPLPYYGQIWSCSTEGVDLQRLDLPLRYVVHSAICRDGIVASDGHKVVFHSGRQIRDLRIFENRTPQNAALSDQPYVAGLYVSEGGELFADVNYTSANTNTLRRIEYYNWDLDAWENASGDHTASTTGVQSFQTGGSLPVSRQTYRLWNRFGYGNTNGVWIDQRMSTAINPWALRKQGNVTPSGDTAWAFEPIGTIQFSSVEIPGLEGMPKVLRRIQFKGNLDSGGTGTVPATCRVQLGDVDTSTHAQGNFTTGYPDEVQERIFRDNESAFYLFAPRITLTRQQLGTDPTFYTPNGLPIVFEGFAFKRDIPLPPFRVEADV